MLPGLSTQRAAACRRVVVAAAGDGSLTVTAPAGVDLSTSMPAQPAALRRWYAVAEPKDPAPLDELLADEAAFRSPAVFAPQQGTTLTASYLSAALKVLGPLALCQPVA